MIIHRRIRKIFRTREFVHQLICCHEYVDPEPLPVGYSVVCSPCLARVSEAREKAGRLKKRGK